MTSRALYDGPADIGLPELDRIVQGVLWIGDSMLLPSYVRPSAFGDAVERQLITTQLRAYVESGRIQRWDVEGLPAAIGLSRWWPSSTQSVTLTQAEYVEIEELVASGVARQKSDLARGAGRPPGSMLSGVAEVVSMRESLWTLGVARALAADVLVSPDARTEALAAPLRMLKHVDRVRGPIVETLLNFAMVPHVGVLPPEDIERLRHRAAPARELVEAVARETEADRHLVNDGELIELVRAATSRRLARATRVALRGDQQAALTSATGGTALTLAGVAFPPLGIAGFAAPMLGWNPRGRDDRKLLVFLSKLNRAEQRRARRSS